MIRRMAAPRMLAAATVATALLACAGSAGRSPATTREAAGTQAPPLAGRPDELREQIRRLDAEIASQLVAAELEAPDPTSIEAAGGVPMADLRTACARSPRETCQDVCRLGDSICDNAAAICDLAAELPGDAWAAGRCDSGKVACKRGNDRCCSC